MMGGWTLVLLALARCKAAWDGHVLRYFRLFREDSWKKYNQKMQERHDEEIERVERIRRMQSVFNRERNKYKRSYENWGGGDQGGFHQHFQRHDWYWTDPSNSYRNPNNPKNAVRENLASSSLSHHYSILGLDRLRGKSYTEAEIKTAFRVKAMECHPDQNQHNKEAAEARFREVFLSYEAIKKEIQNKGVL